MAQYFRSWLFSWNRTSTEREQCFLSLVKGKLSQKRSDTFQLNISQEYISLWVGTAMETRLSTQIRWVWLVLG